MGNNNRQFWIFENGVPLGYFKELNVPTRTIRVLPFGGDEVVTLPFDGSAHKNVVMDSDAVAYIDALKARIAELEAALAALLADGPLDEIGSYRSCRWCGGRDTHTEYCAYERARKLLEDG